MPNEQSVSFLIKKANVTLMVSPQPKRSVSIVPHQCKTENLRLWQSIAQVQNTMAQWEIEAHRETDHYALLLSLFDNKGWTIELT